MPIDQEEILDEATLLRTIDREFINEKGEIKVGAFYLKERPVGKGVFKKEKALSVLLERHHEDHRTIFSEFPNTVKISSFIAAIPRENLLGVCHTPSQRFNGHTDICGYFTDSKIEHIIVSSVTIEKPVEK